MTFYTLKDLNIKIIDFINLLSPLGIVKKIVSNGEQHLVEIYFHTPLNIEINDNIENNYINKTLLKLYYHKNKGYIINERFCILEIPKGIDINNYYINDLKIKDKKNIGKYLRKNIPKDSQNILKHNLLLNNKITDPDKINILKFEGYQRISV